MHTTASNGTGNATTTTTDYVPQPPLLTATLRQAKRARRLEEEHTETLTFALTERDWGPLDTVRGWCWYVCMYTWGLMVID